MSEGEWQSTGSAIKNIIMGIIALRQKADQMAIHRPAVRQCVNEITFYRILTDLLKVLSAPFESTKSVARGQRREPLR